MPLPKEQKTGIVYVSIFLIVILIGFIVNSQQVKQVSNSHHAIVCATITEMYWRKGLWLCKLEFVYKGEKLHFPDKYPGEIGITSKTHHKVVTGNPYVPIVFPVGDPKNFFLLETPEDFIKFKIVPADTVGITCM